MRKIGRIYIYNFICTNLHTHRYTHTQPLRYALLLHAHLLHTIFVVLGFWSFARRVAFWTTVPFFSHFSSLHFLPHLLLLFGLLFLSSFSFSLSHTPAEDRIQGFTLTRQILYCLFLSPALCADSDSNLNCLLTSTLVIKAMEEEERV